MAHEILYRKKLKYSYALFSKSMMPAGRRNKKENLEHSSAINILSKNCD